MIGRPARSCGSARGNCGIRICGNCWIAGGPNWRATSPSTRSSSSRRYVGRCPETVAPFGNGSARSARRLCWMRLNTCKLRVWPPARSIREHVVAVGDRIKLSTDAAARSDGRRTGHRCATRVLVQDFAMYAGAERRYSCAGAGRRIRGERVSTSVRCSRPGSAGPRAASGSARGCGAALFRYHADAAAPCSEMDSGGRRRRCPADPWPESPPRSGGAAAAACRARRGDAGCAGEPCGGRAGKAIAAEARREAGPRGAASRPRRAKECGV